MINPDCCCNRDPCTYDADVGCGPRPHVAPSITDQWTITVRNRRGERIYFAWRLLFDWPRGPALPSQTRGSPHD